MRIVPMAAPKAVLRRAAYNFLPAPVLHGLRRLLGRTNSPAPGKVNLGDVARLKPLGSDRGTPIDDFYVGAFLASHHTDVKGRVLAVGDAGYFHRYGPGLTTHDTHDDQEFLTIGDTSLLSNLEPESFDCLIIAQTLQLIYDMEAAVREMKRALRPGGVLLLTVPGITPIDPHFRGEHGYWSLTGQSARRLFGEIFGPENVEVSVYGNAYAATCFLQGLAVEDVTSELLNQHDPSFPVVVAVRAFRDAGLALRTDHLKS